MSQSGEDEPRDLSKIIEEQNATIKYLQAQLKEFLHLKRTMREVGMKSPKVLKLIEKQAVEVIIKSTFQKLKED